MYLTRCLKNMETIRENKECLEDAIAKLIEDLPNDVACKLDVLKNIIKKDESLSEKKYGHKTYTNHNEKDVVNEQVCLGDSQRTSTTQEASDTTVRKWLEGGTENETTRDIGQSDIGSPLENYRLSYSKDNRTLVMETTTTRMDSAIKDEKEEMAKDAKVDKYNDYPDANSREVVIGKVDYTKVNDTEIPSNSTKDRIRMQNNREVSMGDGPFQATTGCHQDKNECRKFAEAVQRALISKCSKADGSYTILQSVPKRKDIPQTQYLRADVKPFFNDYDPRFAQEFSNTPTREFQEDTNREKIPSNNSFVTNDSREMKYTVSDESQGTKNSEEMENSISDNSREPNYTLSFESRDTRYYTLNDNLSTKANVSSKMRDENNGLSYTMKDNKYIMTKEESAAVMMKSLALHPRNSDDLENVWQYLNVTDSTDAHFNELYHHLNAGLPFITADPPSSNCMEQLNEEYEKTPVKLPKQSTTPPIRDSKTSRNKTKTLNRKQIQPPASASRTDLKLSEIEMEMYRQKCEELERAEHKKLAKHNNRTPTNLRNKFPGSNKPIKTMWGFTKINVYEDASTFEIMQPSEQKPHILPNQIEKVFVVLHDK